MKLAFPISLFGHVLIAASGLFYWHAAPRPPVEEVIDIRLEGLELGRETNVREVIRPEPVEEKTPEPEVVEDVPEGDDQSSSTPDPVEEAAEAIPTITDEPEPEPTPEPKITPTPKPDPSPTPKPIVEKRNTDAKKKDDLSDLFNDLEKTLQSIDSKPGTKSPKTPQNALTDQPDMEPQRGAGDRTGNQAAIGDYVTAQIKQRKCYRSIADLPDADKLSVTISFEMDSRGNVSVPPHRIRPKQVDPRYPLISVATERAIRAINLCDPFIVPEEDYDLWRNTEINITFDEKF